MNKPETLWDLCELTAEAIETQPLNYHQSYWICDAKKEVSSEACGTAFCRAGWMYALSREPSEDLTPLVVGTADGYRIIYITMKSKLIDAGIPANVIDQLFAGVSEDATYHPGLEDIEAGNPEYARIGAEGMRLFMQEYEKELRGAKL